MTGSLSIGRNDFLNNNATIAVANLDKQETVVPEVAPLSKESLKGRVGESVPSKGYCDKIKALFKKIIDGFVHTIRHVVGFFAHSVGTHDNLQSIAKFGKSTVAFFKYAFKAQTEGLENLRSQLGIVDSFLDVPDFLVDLKDWIIKKNHDGQEKLFFRHTGVTKWKIISKIVGTFSKGIGFVNFFIDVGLIKLGRISAYLNTIPFFGVILQFSPLRVIKDSLSIISALFGVADHGVLLRRAQKAAKIPEQKMKKWKIRENLREFLSLSPADKQAKLEQKYKKTNYKDMPPEEKEAEYIKSLKGKYIKVREILKGLGSVPKKELKKDEVALDPETKWQKTVESITEVNAKDLVTKYKDKLDLHTKTFSERKIVQKKNWLAIAFNVFKISAITIGLVGLFAAAGSNLIFLATLATAWFITSSIGIARLYYGFKHQHVV